MIELSNTLVLFPYKYPKEPVYNKNNIRFLTKWSYKIIYRIETDKIIILRIFNTNQHPRRTCFPHFNTQSQKADLGISVHLLI